MKTALKLAMILMASSVGNGCGTDNGGSSDNEKAVEVSETEETSSKANSMALDSKDDMPKCTADNEHQLVYIIDEEIFYRCKDKEWEDTNIRVDVKDNALEETGMMWTDKKTKIRWLILPLARYDISICTSSGAVDKYKFTVQPGPNEIKEVIRHKIFGELNVPVFIENRKMIYSQFPDVELDVADITKAFALCRVK